MQSVKNIFVQFSQVWAALISALSTLAMFFGLITFINEYFPGQSTATAMRQTVCLPLGFLAFYFALPPLIAWVVIKIASNEAIGSVADLELELQQFYSLESMIDGVLSDGSRHSVDDLLNKLNVSFDDDETRRQIYGVLSNLHRKKVVTSSRGYYWKR